jgi:hypothetical protein
MSFKVAKPNNFPKTDFVSKEIIGRLARFACGFASAIGQAGMTTSFPMNVVMA